MRDSAVFDFFSIQRVEEVSWKGIYYKRKVYSSTVYNAIRTQETKFLRTRV